MSRVNEKADELRAMREELSEIEMEVTTSYTLADAIREGSTVTKQAYTWSTDEEECVCAMTAAVIAARSRGFM